MYQEDLIPLRIPAGWNVMTNIFYDEELIPSNMQRYFYGRTLFYAISIGRGRAIDLQWVWEGEDSGHCELKVHNFIQVYNETEMRMDYQHEDLAYYQLKSTDRWEIVAEIERLMIHLPILPDERILKAPGIVDQPAESFRLKLKADRPDKELCTEIIQHGNKYIQNLLIEHPEITPDLLQMILDSDMGEKLKKKAEMILNSKKYRKKHGLWTEENPK